VRTLTRAKSGTIALGEIKVANLPIDGAKITLIATGKVRPVAVYAEMPDGSNRRVPGAQEQTDNGIPIWAVDVQLDDDDANRAEAISVKVPAADEPTVAKWKPVTFTGLVCKPYIPSGGRQVALSMRADGIAGPK
jgi:hypothetical protein